MKRRAYNIGPMSVPGLNQIPKPALWLVAIIQFVAPFALAERWWARLLLILLLWPGAVSEAHPEAALPDCAGEVGPNENSRGR